jgi:hypothetical protein
MNKASQIKHPPISLFGDFVLLQAIRESDGSIVLPEGVAAPSIRNTLFVAAIGDGERVKKIAIGDEVELVHVPKEATVANSRFYPEASKIPYMLCGFDNILGVMTD